MPGISDKIVFFFSFFKSVVFCQCRITIKQIDRKKTNFLKLDKASFEIYVLRAKQYLVKIKATLNDDLTFRVINSYTKILNFPLQIYFKNK